MRVNKLNVFQLFKFAIEKGVSIQLASVYAEVSHSTAHAWATKFLKIKKQKIPQIEKAVRLYEQSGDIDFVKKNFRKISKINILYALFEKGCIVKPAKKHIPSH